MGYYSLIWIALVVCGNSIGAPPRLMKSDEPNPNEQATEDIKTKEPKLVKRQLNFFNDEDSSSCVDDILRPYANSFWDKHLNYFSSGMFQDPLSNSFQLPLDTYSSSFDPTNLYQPNRRRDPKVIVVKPQVPESKLTKVSFKKPLSDILRLDDPFSDILPDVETPSRRKVSVTEEPCEIQPSNGRGDQKYSNNLLKQVLKIVNYVQKKQNKEFDNDEGSKKKKKPAIDVTTSDKKDDGCICSSEEQHPIDKVIKKLIENCDDVKEEIPKTEDKIKTNVSPTKDCSSKSDSAEEPLKIPTEDDCSRSSEEGSGNGKSEEDLFETDCDSAPKISKPVSKEIVKTIKEVIEQDPKTACSDAQDGDSKRTSSDSPLNPINEDNVKPCDKPSVEPLESAVQPDCNSDIKDEAPCEPTGEDNVKPCDKPSVEPVESAVQPDCDSEIKDEAPGALPCEPVDEPCEDETPRSKTDGPSVDPPAAIDTAPGSADLNNPPQPSYTSANQQPTVIEAPRVLIEKLVLVNGQPLPQISTDGSMYLPNDYTHVSNQLFNSIMKIVSLAQKSNIPASDKQIESEKVEEPTAKCASETGEKVTQVDDDKQPAISALGEVVDTEQTVGEYGDSVKYVIDSNGEVIGAIEDGKIETAGNIVGEGLNVVEQPIELVGEVADEASKGGNEAVESNDRSEVAENADVISNVAEEVQTISKTIRNTDEVHKTEEISSALELVNKKIEILEELLKSAGLKIAGRRPEGQVVEKIAETSDTIAISNSELPNSLTVETDDQSYKSQVVDTSESDIQGSYIGGHADGPTSEVIGVATLLGGQGVTSGVVGVAGGFALGGTEEILSSKMGTVTKTITNTVEPVGEAGQVLNSMSTVLKTIESAKKVGKMLQSGVEVLDVVQEPLEIVSNAEEVIQNVDGKLEMVSEITNGAKEIIDPGLEAIKAVSILKSNTISETPVMVVGGLKDAAEPISAVKEVGGQTVTSQSVSSDFEDTMGSVFGNVESVDPSSEIGSKVVSDGTVKTATSSTFEATKVTTLDELIESEFDKKNNKFGFVQDVLDEMRQKLNSQSKTIDTFNTESQKIDLSDGLEDLSSKNLDNTKEFVVPVKGVEKTSSSTVTSSGSSNIIDENIANAFGTTFESISSNKKTSQVISHSEETSNGSTMIGDDEDLDPLSGPSDTFESFFNSIDVRKANADPFEKLNPESVASPTDAVQAAASENVPMTSTLPEHDDQGRGSEIIDNEEQSLHQEPQPLKTAQISSDHRKDSFDIPEVSEDVVENMLPSESGTVCEMSPLPNGLKAVEDEINFNSLDQYSAEVESPLSNPANLEFPKMYPEINHVNAESANMEYRFEDQPKNHNFGEKIQNPYGSNVKGNIKPSSGHQDTLQKPVQPSRSSPLLNEKSNLGTVDTEDTLPNDNEQTETKTSTPQKDDEYALDDLFPSDSAEKSDVSYEDEESVEISQGSEESRESSDESKYFSNTPAVNEVFTGSNEFQPSESSLVDILIPGSKGLAPHSDLPLDSTCQASKSLDGVSPDKTLSPKTLPADDITSELVEPSASSIFASSVIPPEGLAPPLPSPIDSTFQASRMLDGVTPDKTLSPEALQNSSVIPKEELAPPLPSPIDSMFQASKLLGGVSPDKTLSPEALPGGDMTSELVEPSVSSLIDSSVIPTEELASPLPSPIDNTFQASKMLDGVTPDKTLSPEALPGGGVTSELLEPSASSIIASLVIPPEGLAPPLPSPIDSAFQASKMLDGVTPDKTLSPEALPGGDVTSGLVEPSGSSLIDSSVIPAEGLAPPLPSPIDSTFQASKMLDGVTPDKTLSPEALPGGEVTSELVEPSVSSLIDSSVIPTEELAPPLPSPIDSMFQASKLLGGVSPDKTLTPEALPGGDMTSELVEPSVSSLIDSSVIPTEELAPPLPSPIDSMFQASKLLGGVSPDKTLSPEALPGGEVTSELVEPSVSSLTDSSAIPTEELAPPLPSPIDSTFQASKMLDGVTPDKTLSPEALPGGDVTSELVEPSVSSLIDSSVIPTEELAPPLPSPIDNTFQASKMLDGVTPDKTLSPEALPGGGVTSELLEPSASSIIASLVIPPEGLAPPLPSPIDSAFQASKMLDGVTPDKTLSPEALPGGDVTSGLVEPSGSSLIDSSVIPAEGLAPPLPSPIDSTFQASKMLDGVTPDKTLSPEPSPRGEVTSELGEPSVSSLIDSSVIPPEGLAPPLPSPIDSAFQASKMLDGVTPDKTLSPEPSPGGEVTSELGEPSVSSLIDSSVIPPEGLARPLPSPIDSAFQASKMLDGVTPDKTLSPEALPGGEVTSELVEPSVSSLIDSSVIPKEELAPPLPSPIDNTFQTPRMLDGITPDKTLSPEALPGGDVTSELVEPSVSSLIDSSVIPKEELAPPLPSPIDNTFQAPRMLDRVTPDKTLSPETLPGDDDTSELMEPSACSLVYSLVPEQEGLAHSSTLPLDSTFQVSKILDGVSPDKTLSSENLPGADVASPLVEPSVSSLIDSSVPVLAPPSHFSPDSALHTEDVTPVLPDGVNASQNLDSETDVLSDILPEENVAPIPEGLPSKNLEPVRKNGLNIIEKSRHEDKPSMTPDKEITDSEVPLSEHSRSEEDDEMDTMQKSNKDHENSSNFSGSFDDLEPGAEDVTPELVVPSASSFIYSLVPGPEGLAPHSTFPLDTTFQTLKMSDGVSPEKTLTSENLQGAKDVNSGLVELSESSLFDSLVPAPKGLTPDSTYQAEDVTTGLADGVNASQNLKTETDVLADILPEENIATIPEGLPSKNLEPIKSVIEKSQHEDKPNIKSDNEPDSEVLNELLPEHSTSEEGDEVDHMQYSNEDHENSSNFSDSFEDLGCPNKEDEKISNGNPAAANLWEANIESEPEILPNTKSETDPGHQDDVPKSLDSSEKLSDDKIPEESQHFYTQMMPPPGVPHLNYNNFHSNENSEVDHYSKSYLGEYPEDILGLTDQTSGVDLSSLKTPRFDANNGKDVKHKSPSENNLSPTDLWEAFLAGFSHGQLINRLPKSSETDELLPQTDILSALDTTKSESIEFHDHNSVAKIKRGSIQNKPIVHQWFDEYDVPVTPSSFNHNPHVISKRSLSETENFSAQDSKEQIKFDKADKLTDQQTDKQTEKPTDKQSIKSSDEDPTLNEPSSTEVLNRDPIVEYVSAGYIKEEPKPEEVEDVFVENSEELAKTCEEKAERFLNNFPNFIEKASE